MLNTKPEVLRDPGGGWPGAVHGGSGKNGMKNQLGSLWTRGASGTRRVAALSCIARRAVLLVGLAWGLFAGGGQAALAQNTATVTTDQPDYPPGATVYIAGAGFQPGEIVQCQVLRIDIDENSGPEHDPWTVTADANGNFTTSWVVTADEAGAMLQLTATGTASGLTARVVFTDATSATISVDAQSGALTYGTAGSATYLVHVHGTGNGGIIVTFIVSSGLPSGASASFSPASVAVDNKGDATSTLTLTTASTTAAAAAQSFTVGSSTGAGSVIAGNGSVAIGKRSLTVAATGVNKAYDGTAAATATLSDNRVTGDNLTDSYANASFADKNVGDGKGITVSGISLGGAAAGNYTLQNTTASTTANISTRGITVTAAGDSKTYDGTADSAGAPSITSGSLAVGDSAAWTQSFDTRGAGTGKVLTPAGAVSDSNGGNNYNVSFVSVNTGVILPKSLSVSGLTAPATTYDGTTTAKLSGSAAFAVTETAGSGTASDGQPYEVDSVSPGGTAAGTLAAKDVGAQSVTVAGVTVTGTGSGNYTVTQQTGLTQTVSPKTLTVSGLSVSSSRTYDGTTAAVVSGSPGALQGTEAAGTGSTGDGKPYSVDAVSLTGTATGTYDSKDVNSATTVSFGGVSLTGAGSGNYTLSIPSQAATITAASTTSSLASSLNPAWPSSNITFTATIAAIGAGSAVPTGTVQFLSNGTNNGAPVALAAGGQATRSVRASTLGHGNKTIVVLYANTDGNFSGSTSSSLGQLVDTPPTAGTHFLGATLNTALHVSATTLAGLDYDADGDTLSITAVSATSTNGGTASLDSNTQLITYNPPANYSGSDQFSYIVDDGFGVTAQSKAVVNVRLGKATSVLNFISSPVNGQVNVRGYGVPGNQYDVQESSGSTFATYTVLATVTAAPNGVVAYTDTDANSSPRFYRLAVH